jgi:Arc/MetJ-type ribon-helix-helix transcriptional regulator
MNAVADIKRALPQDLQDAMDSAIAEGRFESNGDILIDALYLWLDEETLRQAKLKKLHELIAKGEEGPYLDGPTAMTALRKRMVERAKQSGAL